LELAPLRSNWIEFFAVPIAISIMESQPIIIILAIFAPLFSSGGQSVPLGETTITLLLLGLLWWAMLGKSFVLRGVSERKVQIWQVGGLVLALAAVGAVSFGQIGNILALFLVIVLVVWCWKRGLDWARTGLDDEHIITAFRVGFCVLLVGLVVGILLLNMASPLVLAVQAQAIPLFFMSGLIGLSFTRLGLVRRENARHSPTGTDPTRSWLTILSIVWVIVVVASLALETFSFQVLLAIMPFFWNVLGTIVTWIVYALYFLLSPLLSWLFNGGNITPPAARPTGPAPKPQQPPHVTPIAPEAVLIGQIVLSLIVLAILVLIVRAIIRRWRVEREEDEEEEEREALPVQEILKTRREERRKKKKEGPALEALEPGSARARYRELLQTMVESNERLARRPNETPAEYETRLRAQLPHRAATTMDTEQPPSDAAILEALTQSYARERYGGVQTGAVQRKYLSTWVPHLLKRFTGRTKGV
jgi:hypothetical protein